MFSPLFMINITKRFCTCSNIDKFWLIIIMQVPLWHQKASHRADGVILWDYHVICIQVMPLNFHSTMHLFNWNYIEILNHILLNFETGDALTEKKRRKVHGFSMGFRFISSISINSIIIYIREYKAIFRAIFWISEVKNFAIKLVIYFL